MKRSMLMSIAALLVTGCCFREIDYNFYDLSAISLEIVPEEEYDIPDEYAIVFFDKDKHLKTESSCIGLKGVYYLLSGKYDLAVYSDVSSNNKFRGVSLSQYECYTGESIFSAYFKTKEDNEEIIVSPDVFMMGFVEDIEVEKPVTADRTTVKVFLKKVVQTYSFFIPVKGIDYLVSATGLVSGMANSYNIYSEELNDPSCSIILEITKGERDGIPGVWCSFNTFGLIDDKPNILYLFDIKLPDGSSQTFEYDISQLIRNGGYVVPTTIEIDYAPGKSGIDTPSVSNWSDTTQIIQLD